MATGTGVKRLILLGNEAIAYGAVEAGLGFASAYPGTPSTEIIETLFRLAPEYGFYVEWSANEKVALEAAYGAAIGGLNSLVAMKHVGVNVAMDPLTSSAYTGVEGSFVIVSADDPGMWSSQNEQDNRWYGVRSYIPVIEAGTVAELKEVTKAAFEVSKRFKHPVLLRTTTRLSHSRCVFDVYEPEGIRRWGDIVRRPEKYSMVPSVARRLRSEMLRRWRDIERFMESFRFNWLEGDGDILLIGVGASYGVLKDSIDVLGIQGHGIRILKLSGFIPLPKGLLSKAFDGVSRVLIVEELEPVIETLIKAWAFDMGYNIPIFGKKFIPLEGELTIERVVSGLARFLGMANPLIENRVSNDVLEELPPRPPNLCPGCPHRGSFYSLRKALAKAGVRPIYNGDIGCYSLGILPPYRMQDTLVDMGSSIGFANGFAHILKDNKVPVAIIGDSTFFHSGLPALVNAIYNRAPMLVVILDNRVTAMTGAQPHPGSGYFQDGSKAPRIDLESVVKGMGVEFVVKFDPFNINDSIEKLYEAAKYVKERNAVAVAIAERACTLYIVAQARRKGIELPLYAVDMDRCTGCGICYNAFSCPAILPLDDKRAYIDPSLCVGCGECVYVCPHDAFYEVKPWSKEYTSLW